MAQWPSGPLSPALVKPAGLRQQGQPLTYSEGPILSPFARPGQVRLKPQEGLLPTRPPASAASQLWSPVACPPPTIAPDALASMPTCRRGLASGLGVVQGGPAAREWGPLPLSPSAPGGPGQSWLPTLALRGADFVQGLRWYVGCGIRVRTGSPHTPHPLPVPRFLPMWAPH